MRKEFVKTYRPLVELESSEGPGCVTVLLGAQVHSMALADARALLNALRAALVTQGPCYPTALESQIGGDHYKSCSIQPVQYIEANALPFLEGCVVKRVTRHAKATGKGRQDIEKAIHELQLLVSLRYSDVHGAVA